MNHELTQWILSGEDWLMGRILHYAKRQGYSRYTSTLEEAWRISIHELSAALVRAVDGYPDVIEFEADETFDGDPICEFALLEADRHRQRGIPLTMFLGLFKYYRQADIYVIASLSSFEGFPRTIWEAMAHSLPVVATKVGSIPDYLKNKVQALLVNPRRPNEFKENLEIIISNSTLRKKLIREGKLLAKENTLSVRAKELLSVIKKHYRNNAI